MTRISIALLFLWVLITPAAFAADPASTPDQLRQTISEGQSMLDDGQYEAFIRRFVDPEDLDKILKSTSMEELVATFAEQKVEALKSALADSAARGPSISEDGTVATFPTSTKKPLIFHKRNGAWYLRN